MPFYLLSSTVVLYLRESTIEGIYFSNTIEYQGFETWFGFETVNRMFILNNLRQKKIIL